MNTYSSAYFRMIACLLAVFTVAGAYAHDGGHYHSASSDHLNRWELTSGTFVNGNFSSIHKGILHLEAFGGRIVSVPFASLTGPSRKMAEMHQKRVEGLNKPFLLRKEEARARTYNGGKWIFVASFLIMIILSFRYPLPRSFLTVSAALFFSGWVIFIACKKGVTGTSDGTPSIPKTSTGFLDSAFAPYKPGISTSYDNNYYYVSSEGWPSHNMMVGITSWQQQVPVPQPYSGNNHWSIPLQPVFASIPLSTRTNFMRGAVAIAVNGIPIFNALNNRGVDSYAIGELDQWGGHCGRADDYHYHAAPLHLAQTSGNRPIAFALDGFPVYGANEPDGSSQKALDTCHGHELTGQVYHYHGTTSYPYVVGAMRGKVNIDPTTPAPENQILPQAFASPVRPATTPLNGAAITDFISTGPNAYKLTYRLGNKNGYVEYSWTSTGNFTYKLTDTAGTAVVQQFKR